MAKATKLLFGVGINDSNYVTQKEELVGYGKDGKRKRKIVWICPFYRKWKNMLGRCYDENYHLRQPTYIQCTVSPEWQSFMSFRAWMIEQDWEGKCLDKDLLIIGNKIYSADTCVFIDEGLNKFLGDRRNHRGPFPIGVTLHRISGKYNARCMDVIKGINQSLGYYHSPEEAHQAWLSFKLQQAYVLAAEQTDPRVAVALIDRYENYAKYFPQPT